MLTAFQVAAGTRQTIGSAPAENAVATHSLDSERILQTLPPSHRNGSRPEVSGSAASAGPHVLDLPLHRLLPDPASPATHVTEADLRRLPENLKATGGVEPIRVRYTPMLDRYVIVTGQQCWRSAQVAGLKTVPCVLAPETETAEHWELWVTEELARPDLDPLATARAYRLLMEWKGWTGRTLAAALGLHPSKVSRMLALLKLPEEEQARVAAGQRSVKDAVRSTVKPRSGSRQRALGTVTIKTTAGTVTITPRVGQAVETVLYLALQQTHTQLARAA